MRANAIMKRGLEFFIEHLGLYRLDSSALEMELAFIRISIAYTQEKRNYLNSNEADRLNSFKSFTWLDKIQIMIELFEKNQELV